MTNTLTPDHVADAHDSLVELLADMPDDQLARLVAPLVELEPSAIASIGKRQGTAQLLGFGTKRPPRGLADLVVELLTHTGERIRVVVFEVQLSFDRSKLHTWPMIQTSAGVHARIDTVDTHLLVLAPNPKLREDISRLLVPRIQPRPKLLQPDHIELIHDYPTARTKAHTAILSGIVRSREPDGRVPLETKTAALRAAYIALRTMHELDKNKYSALIHALAPALLVERALRELHEEGELEPSLEDLVSETERGGHSFTLGHKEGREQGLQEGLQQGLQQSRAHLRQATLHMLEQRSISPGAPILEALEASEDIVLLGRVYAAACSQSLEDLRALLQA